MSVVFETLQAVGALATAVGVFLALWQLRIQRQQQTTAFEDGLTQQYRDVLKKIPIQALLGVEVDQVILDDSLSAFYRYMDLTNEQIFLTTKGRVSRQTWSNWQDGISTNMSRPAFRDAWNRIISKAPDSFLELQRLAQENYRSEPWTWDPADLLSRNASRPKPSGSSRLVEPRAEVVMPSDAPGRILAIRKASNASWSNIRKAIAALRGEQHEAFGTENVESSSKSVVRRMLRETGKSIDELTDIVDDLAVEP